jgi:hypothetical protein
MSPSLKPSFARPKALLCAAVLFAISLAAPAEAQDAVAPPDPNMVCGPGVSAGQFKLDEIGPRIAGTWSAEAAGLGFTAGVHAFTANITFERGRIYILANGTKIELKPVYGTRKELRYDPIRQQALPKAAHAVKVSLEDIGLVTDCEIGLAPQFTWTYGTGARSSGGVYSFLDSHTAIGTMWNSAQGAREVYLSR